MPWFSSDVSRLIKRAESTGAKGQPYELPSAAADHHESGNALIEFIVLGTMLMLPTMYFLISVFALQSGAFAASNASQQSLQYLQQVEPGLRGQGAAQSIAERAASDYGVDASKVSTQLGCEDTCANGERLTVSVSIEVQLPLIPWPGAPTIATMTSQAISWGGLYS